MTTCSFNIYNARQRSCGEVMFLHCGISVHGEGGGPSGCRVPCSFGGVSERGVPVNGGLCEWRGLCGRGI